MNNLGYSRFFSSSANRHNLSYCLFSEEITRVSVLQKNANQYAPKKAKPWMGSVLPGTEVKQKSRKTGNGKNFHCYST
jgi:hypothetical protein